MEALLFRGVDIAASTQDARQGKLDCDAMTTFGPTQYSSDTFNPYHDFHEAAFERLRWSVFDPAGVVAIRVDNDTESEDPEATPFSENKDQASQYVTETPQGRLSSSSMLWANMRAVERRPQLHRPSP